MTEPDFERTYQYLYKIVTETHKGLIVDQAALMDGAVRIYLDEKERWYKERENESHGRAADNLGLDSHSR